MQIASFKLPAHGEQFSVCLVADTDTGVPWENGDCHGPVRCVQHRREKRPGERPLSDLGDSRRNGWVYDWQAAMVQALRDGWGVAGGQLPGETARAYAARAVQADFDYLRAWVNDDWHYVGVIVTDRHGEEASLWGVEYSGGAERDQYIREVVEGLAEDLQWPRVQEWRAALRRARAARVAYAGWMTV